MAPPQMFDDVDPVLERFRSIALKFPEAKEKVSHGRPTFFTKKVFACFGAARKDASSEIVQHPHGVLVLLDPLDAEVMLERRDSFVPMYLSPAGWIGLEVEQLGDEELYDVLADSYRNTAPARLAKLIVD